MSKSVGHLSNLRAWVVETLGVACDCPNKAQRNSFFIFSELCAGFFSSAMSVFTLSTGGAKSTVVAWLVLSTLPLINAVCMKETCRTDLGAAFARVQVLLMALLAGMAMPASGFAILAAGALREILLHNRGKLFGLMSLPVCALILVGYSMIGQMNPSTLAMGAFGYFAGLMLGIGMDLATREAEIAPEAELTPTQNSDSERGMLNAMPGCLMILQPNGDVKQQFGQQLEAFKQPLLNRTLFERMHVHDRPLFLKSLADTHDGKGASDFKVRLQVDLVGEQTFAGYEWFSMQLRQNPLRDEVLALMQNAQSEYEKIEALVMAKKDAEDASAAKGRFLGVMSHELRTPLNAIIGFADMLTQAEVMGLKEAQKSEYANIIKNSGEHLLEIIESLLSMAKLESNSLELAVEPFAFDKVLSSALDMLQLRFAKAKLNVNTRVDPMLSDINADPRAMRQILINLLSNALKFTPEGGEIQIYARNVDDKFILSVKDTGCGIGAEDVVRLGQPFFQASSGHARAAEGTGLGLAIVKGLASLHGGGFSVESKPDEGSTFSVWLPLKHDNKSSATPEFLNIQPRWGDEETYKKLKEKKRA